MLMPLPTTWKPVWRSTLTAILLVFFVLLIRFVHQHNQPQPIQITQTTPSTSTQLVIPNVAKPAVIPAPVNKAESPWQTVIIKKGDSLAKIFTNLNIPYTKLQKIMSLQSAHEYLESVKPGDKLYFNFDKKHVLKQMKYMIDDNSTLLINNVKLNNNSKDYTAEVIKAPFTMAIRYKTFVIHGSFIASAFKASLTHHLFLQLASIFASTIDFKRDLQLGDRFSILYEEYFRNGKQDHPGNIVAAEFNHQGKIYQAIRYSYPNHRTAYYAPNGHALESLFLHAPLHYKRISSYFTYHRYDPVLHIVHSHLGIDYAAHIGTPIKSIGDGRVAFVGLDRGYGNTVIISYGHKYRALYGHLEHFKRHLHSGEYVHKGQTIGYVGETGWATGPHLHFGFYVHGVPFDYLKLKFHGGKPVPHYYKRDFLAKAKTLIEQMQFYHSIEFANEQKDNNPRNSS